MNLDNIFNEVVEEQANTVLKTSRNKPIADAIVNRNPITFYYSGPRKPKKTSVKAGYRVKAEAVALGLNKKGNLVIRAFIDNPSKSKRGTPSNVGNEKANYGWRTFLVARMSGIQVLKNETFDTPREKFNGKDTDGSMTTTYVSTVFGSKLKPPKEKKPTPSTPEVTPEPEITTEPEVTSKPTAEPEKTEPAVINKAKPTKTVDLNKATTQKVAKQTSSFDQEISNVQNELSKVDSEMKSNNEKYQQLKNTPEGGKEYLNKLKELTPKKKELEKRLNDLVDLFAQSAVSQKNVAVQKYLSAKSRKPTDTLPEIPKKEKPAPTPEDEKEALNESFLNRIKKLINKMEYI